MDNRIITVDPNGNGKRGLPKLRDIFRRQRQDSDVSLRCYCLFRVKDDYDYISTVLKTNFCYCRQANM